MRILLAEDNETNERVARQLLNKLGHSTISVPNGLEVLNTLADDRAFDCILMDLAMPVMDGLEATRHVIETYPDPTQRPPIIAVTANAFTQDRERCLDAGMIDFLPKPLRLDPLREALSNTHGSPSSIPGSFSFAPTSPVRKRRLIFADESEIDCEIFTSFVEIDDEEALSIFDDFCLDVPLQIGRMDQFASTGDSKAFGDLAHQLKGSSATFGLVTFSNHMGEMEDMVLAGDLSGLHEGWARELLREFQRGERILRSHLQPQ